MNSTKNKWSEWGEWGACGTKCGKGFRERLRTCPNDQCQEGFPNFIFNQTSMSQGLSNFLVTEQWKL